MSAPIACTLSGPDLEVRLTAIAELARRALLGHERRGPILHLRYDLAAAAELEKLVEQERICCAFLDFDLARRADAVHLDIKVPAQAAEFVDTLLAHFLGKSSGQAVEFAAPCRCPQ